MVFAIPKEQRDDLVTRMDDTAALGPLLRQTGGTRAKAEEIEERAFSVAEGEHDDQGALVRGHRWRPPDPRTHEVIHQESG